MNDAAPWLDYQQPAATSPPASTAPNDNAPWLDYQKATPPAASDDFIPHFAPGYAAHLADSIDSAITTAKSSGVVSSIAGAGEAAAHIIAGMITPVAAVAAGVPKTVWGALTGTKSVDANGNIVYPGATPADYVKSKEGIQSATNLIPNNPFSQAAQDVAGKTVAPIADASAAIAKHLSDDPNTQQMLTDVLPYTLGAAGEIRLPGAKEAPSTLFNNGSTSPLVKLADTYDIPLTKGQMLRSTATSAESGAMVNALNLPSQIEAAVAKTSKGAQLQDFFTDQQNNIARKFEELRLNDFRANGGSIKDFTDSGAVEQVGNMKGVNVLNPTKARLMAEDLEEGNPELAGKLNDLADIARHTQSVTPTTLTAQGTRSLYVTGAKLAPVVGGTALGALVGHGLGLGGEGSIIGFLGGEFAHGQGLASRITDMPVNRQISRVGKDAPTDTALLVQDVRAMAKRAGVSTDVMAKELTARGFNLR